MHTRNYFLAAGLAGMSFLPAQSFAQAAFSGGELAASYSYYDDGDGDDGHIYALSASGVIDFNASTFVEVTGFFTGIEDSSFDDTEVGGLQVLLGHRLDQTLTFGASAAAAWSDGENVMIYGGHLLYETAPVTSEVAVLYSPEDDGYVFLLGRLEYELSEAFSVEVTGSHYFDLEDSDDDFTIFGLSGEYDVTPQMRVNAGATFLIDDDTDIGDAVALEVGMDYDITDQLELSAAVGTTVGSDTNDDITFMLGLTYTFGKGAAPFDLTSFDTAAY